MKRILRQIALIVALLAFAGHYTTVYGQNSGQTEESEVTCMAESPIDGSLWMGTANNGLYRLSKTGSRLHFGASGGKLGSDSILYICFDSNAKLWILGKEGSLASYTAKDGFRKKLLGNEEISGAIYLPKKDKLMLASVTKLIAFDPKSESIESEVKIPFPPVNLKLSSDSSFVWIFGEKQVARLANDGSVMEWSGVGDVSNMLPLEFETYIEQDASKQNIWLIIIVCLAALGCVIIVIFLLGKRRVRRVTQPLEPEIKAHAESVYEGVNEAPITVLIEEPAEPVEEPEKPVEKPKKKAAAVTKSSSLSGPFTTRVMMLIEEHYKETDFDVDAIAEITGMSRIHVNRKLKAEGSPSPSVLLRDRRMEVAKFYLMQSEMPMTKIASECGFRSASYFTTAFKEYTGVTPSEFVAQNKL